MKIERDTPGRYKEIMEKYKLIRTIKHTVHIRTNKTLGTRIFHPKYKQKTSPEKIEFTLTGTTNEIEREKESIREITQEIERINKAYDVLTKHLII